jgi:hypothetical protein
MYQICVSNYITSVSACCRSCAGLCSDIAASRVVFGKFFESRPGLQFRPSFRGFSRCLFVNAVIVPGLWGGCFLRNSYQLSTYPTDYDATGSIEILTSLSTYRTDNDETASFDILTHLSTYRTDYDAVASFEILTNLIRNINICNTFS